MTLANTNKVRDLKECGVGVFALRDVTLEELRLAMPGFLAPVSGEEYCNLLDSEHPSLFEWNDYCFILFGPLSLVNHACYSNVRIGQPLELESGKFPLLDRNTKDHRDVGDEWAIKVVYFECSGKQSWNSGEQILIRYENKPRNCICELCKINRIIE